MRHAVHRALGTACALAFAATAGLAQSSPDGTTTIHVADRVLVSPDTMLTGDEARIAVRDGRILNIGREIPASVQQSAVVVRHEGAWITPGLVLAHGYLSLQNDLAETIDAFTPSLRAVDAFDPLDEALPRLARAGVTAVGLAPASKNTFGGLGSAVVMTIDDASVVRGSVLEETTYLKMALVPESLDQGRYPTSRMGAVDMIRAAFADARSPLRSSDPDLAVLAAVADGERRVVVHASSHAEISGLLDLCDEIGVSVSLLGARDAGESLGRLPERVRGVALSPLTFGSKPEQLALPKQLHDAGIPLAFVGATADAMRLSAALAVRNGLPRAAAWAALTRTPAAMLGADDRIGGLRNGMRADFVVWSGDPTNLHSSAGGTWIAGKALTNGTRAAEENEE